jgi:hypothetical protein
VESEDDILNQIPIAGNCRIKCSQLQTNIQGELNGMGIQFEQKEARPILVKNQ